MTGHLDLNALLLFLIVFVWTPPHFWALAIARSEEYAKAGIPMLPVTHGIAFTATYVLSQTIGLAAIVVVPYFTGLRGPLYLAGAIPLSAMFVRHAAALGMRTLRYSIDYLLLLFTLLIADHYIGRR